jgi:uncharacterized protein YqeY
MSSLREQLQADVAQAMKRGDTVCVSTLRLLHAALQNREIAKRQPLTDAEVLESVALAARQRREAIAFAQQYGRADVAAREQQELAILEAYLPEPLSPTELTQRIEAVVQELGATSPRDMGRVMQVLMPTLQGRAAGETVSRLVRQRLTAPPHPAGNTE